MKWVCNGKTNFEIGVILDISFFTVKTTCNGYSASSTY